MTVEWRVYYEDGSVFDDTQGSWDDAPIDGVQAVAVRNHLCGRQVHSGREYYLIPPHIDHVVSVNDLGPTLRRLRWIKFGREIPKEQFQKILKQACEDPVFPKTSPRRRASDNPEYRE